MFKCSKKGEVLRKEAVTTTDKESTESFFITPNEPRIFKGYLKKGEVRIRNPARKVRLRLHNLIENGVCNLGWGVNWVSADFYSFRGKDYVAVQYMNLDDSRDDQLTRSVGATPNPLTLENPEVRKIVEEIVQPAIKQVLGEEVEFVLFV